MSIRVVYDVPARHTGRAATGTSTRVAGVLLMGVALVGLCGTVAAALLGGALLAVSASAGIADPDGRWVPDWVHSPLVADPSALVDPAVRLGLGLVASFVVLWLGLVVLRRSRHAVLFLRRFGYDDATRAVTTALAVLGSTWRVVTLDDSVVRTVGIRRSAVTRTSRAAMRRARGARSLVLVATLVLAAVLVSQDDVANDDPSVLLPPGLRGGDPLRVDSPAQAAIGALLAVVAALVAAKALRTLLFPAVLVSRRVERNVRRAEGTARQSVDDAAGVERVGRLVERMRTRVLSPQLMVVTSSNAVWRDAVARLLRSTEVTLVDVSRPTESLLWEIRALSEHDDGRCVYIGHVDRLATFVPGVAQTAPTHWQVPRFDPLAAPPDSVIGQIEQVLDGHEVLAYSSDPAHAGVFARSLARHLGAALAGPAPVPVTWGATRQFT